MHHIPVRIVRLLLPAISLLACTGCGGLLVGHWNMSESVPNKETFAIDNAWFKSDGTYSAVTTREGMTVAEAGKYEYDGFKIHFRPSAGGQRSYSASIIVDTLEIIDGNRKVVLKKAK